MPNRNDPCPCGSGKKYKKCCLDKDVAAKPSTRPAGRVPSTNAPASPVGGEVVLFCIHAGPAFQGSKDPSQGRFAIPAPDFNPPELHWFFVSKGLEFKRPGDKSFTRANWIAACNRCTNFGTSTEDVQIGGDYTWPNEDEDSPPFIPPPPSNRRNPNQRWPRKRNV